MIEILIVEDEAPIRTLLQMSLEDAGYHCTCAEDGMEAADILETRRFDLALLDIMLPRVDGYELFEYIKPLGIPVIFLTAKATLDDRVKGLLMGAEDYIVKPFEILELLARVSVVLRRYNKEQSILTFADVTIQTRSMLVLKGDDAVSLTPREYELLVFLVRNRGMILTREQIFEHVWGGMYDADTRTLDLHVMRLRKKLGLEKSLVTIHKVGYRLA